MSKTRNGFRGLSLLLSLAGLGAQPRETASGVEVGIHNYSAVSAKALVRAEQETGGVRRAIARPNSTGYELQLTVRVYNPAHVPPFELSDAEHQAARIFRRAKIKIVWEHVPMPDEVHDHVPSQEWNPADLHLRLWTRASVGLRTYGEDTLGFCVSLEMSTAIIISDEIRKRGATAVTNPGELLGLVMAHEIGHLLLRSKAHSAEGIMQARLATDLRDRTRTLLVLTRQQAIAVRYEVRRRMAVQSAQIR
jgi:hypothetical protein